MQITIDIEDRVAKDLMIEAKKDGHENHSAIVRKAIGLFLHHIAKRSK